MREEREKLVFELMKSSSEFHDHEYLFQGGICSELYCVLRNTVGHEHTGMLLEKEIVNFLQGRVWLTDAVSEMRNEGYHNNYSEEVKSKIRIYCLEYWAEHGNFPNPLDIPDYIFEEFDDGENYE